MEDVACIDATALLMRWTATWRRSRARGPRPRTEAPTKTAGSQLLDSVDMAQLPTPPTISTLSPSCEGLWNFPQTSPRRVRPSQLKLGAHIQLTG